eukprot:15455606-Alexandrium_andersonii.AAC.1
MSPTCAERERARERERERERERGALVAWVARSHLFHGPVLVGRQGWPTFWLLAKACADGGLADCGLGSTTVILRFQAASGVAFVGRSGTLCRMRPSAVPGTDFEAGPAQLQVCTCEATFPCGGLWVQAGCRKDRRWQCSSVTLGATRSFRPKGHALRRNAQFCSDRPRFAPTGPHWGGAVQGLSAQSEAFRYRTRPFDAKRGFSAERPRLAPKDLKE